MITKVVIENFKKFQREEFLLDETVVLAGPNNTGKTSLLQAISTWWFALQKWRQGKGSGAGKATLRTGQAVTRKDFSALPLSEFDLLWNDRATALRKDERIGGEKPGTPRLIHITLEGLATDPSREPWRLTMELRYQGSEQIYVKPVLPEDETSLPEAAAALTVVHCPPFSGIGSDEHRLDIGAQNLLIGEGKPGDILRNLILEVAEKPDRWERLVDDIKELFGYTLLKPDYTPSMPFIRCEYLEGISRGGKRAGLNRFELASAGSGFHQVLLLLSFFHARPATVLLIDEPDAHLHVILQRQIYDRLRSVAAKRNCQLLIATHAEVILDGTDPERVVSFLGKPHRLVQRADRDRVREAMKRLTTLDLLLAEQGRAVLYCEGETDFRILRAWAHVLDHPSKAFFDKPFFHSIGGRNPREGREHLFALRSVRPQLCGLLLLDGDNRELPEHEIVGDGLSIRRWERYEIENYLLVPSAIERFLNPASDQPDLFKSRTAETALDFLGRELPPATFDDPLKDNATTRSVAASKDIFPKMFDEIGVSLEKGEYYRIAEAMAPEEIHPAVREILDAIAALLPAEDEDD
ncbi:MAG: AAA family ATPase [Vicinamibacteria bacterium]